MTRRMRGWQSVAVLGIAGLTLAACGGGDAEPEDTAAAGGDDTAAATEEPMEEPTDGGETAAGGGGGDGTLTIGTLLPETGSLAFLGPPEFAGVDLAVQEINEAGGVLDNDVVKIDGDSGDTTTDIATQTVTRLLGEGVDAIIGAASSGVSFTVIDQITGAGVVHFSPANTSPDFTDYDDNGLYFRTAPSDVLQGRVLGDLLVQDGCLDAAAIVLDDPYGTGLIENVQASLEAGGGSLVTDPILYPEGTDNFSAQVTQVADAGAECVVLIGFAETAQIITEMVAQGLSPADVPTYFVDGNLSNYGEDLPEGTLEGNKGTLPGAEAPEEFQNRLLEVDPDLNDFSYAAESYDAAIVIALAAVAAGSDDGVAIGAEIPGVTREGTECTDFASCKELLDSGEDIDYNGVSGPIELSDQGDPTQATIGIFEYGPDNNYTRVDSLSGTI
ncbi:ABC transporter substrate-binding protein [Aquipuribacter nitratireducens]|uniref:ABC transporter substrate-binding protein n=1 Tax=Aquipuribacter nitratireducens TaxID=650104 RepID=A0ABW0GI77_9MICO